MANFKLQTRAMALAATPTPLWQAGDTHNQQAPSITIEAGVGDIFVGDDNITGASDAMNVVAGCAKSMGNLEIRGNDMNYDLSEIYYLGGPGVLILEVESDR